MRSSYVAVALLIATAALASCNKEPPEAARQTGPAVVVYSALPEDRVQPVLDAFVSQTGNRVNLVSGEFEKLIDKVRKPGSGPVADLFLADNVADLWYAAEEDVFRPTRSDRIANWIPAQMRDPEHLWTALSARVRVIVFNRNEVSGDEIATISGYASLSDERWRNRLCLSSSTVPGNGSLIAMLINDEGVRNAELVVRGWRANFALPPREDDEALLAAIADGSCNLGLVDTSVAAAFQDKSSTVAVHLLPPQAVTHLNITGAGVTRHAKNPDGAHALLDWLVDQSANAQFSALQLEYPAHPRSEIEDSISAWAVGNASPVNLATLGYLQEDAKKLAERARYP